MRKTHYSRKTRQLKRLIQKLKSAQELMLSVIIKRLTFKIKTLIQQLSSVFTKYQLRTILGSTAVFIGLTTLSNNIHAQNFVAAVQNPFGLNPSTEGFGGTKLVDLDNDGDLDLFQGSDGGTIDYFKNIGTSTNPIFANPQTNSFGLTNSYYISVPTTADIDNDGDLDIFIGEVYGNIKFYENTGNATVPFFAPPITNAFGITATYFLSLPAFADLDNDGDQDLLAGNFTGDMNYFENIGSSSAPNFTAPITNPFGIQAVNSIAFPTFVDLDLDGDFDLMVGEYYGNNVYFENIGSLTTPIFATSNSNPFGLSSVYLFSSPTFGDLDGDGDFDMISSEYGGNIQYFQNTSSPCIPTTNSIVANGIDQYIAPSGAILNTSGVYTDTVMNAAGCDSIITINLQLQYSGLNEINNGVSCYPNPINDVLSFQSNKKINKLEIQTLLGTLVKTIDEPEVNINLIDLKPGVYLFNFYDDNGQKYCKKIEKK